MLSIAIVLLFVAMLLAPCLIALRNWMRGEQDTDETVDEPTEVRPSTLPQPLASSADLHAALAQSAPAEPRMQAGPSELPSPARQLSKTDQAAESPDPSINVPGPLNGALAPHAAVTSPIVPEQEAESVEAATGSGSLLAELLTAWKAGELPTGFLDDISLESVAARAEVEARLAQLAAKRAHTAALQAMARAASARLQAASGVVQRAQRNAEQAAAAANQAMEHYHLLLLQEQTQSEDHGPNPLDGESETFTQPLAPERVARTELQAAPPTERAQPVLYRPEPPTSSAAAAVTMETQAEEPGLPPQPAGPDDQERRAA